MESENCQRADILLAKFVVLQIFSVIFSWAWFCWSFCIITLLKTLNVIYKFWNLWKTDFFCHFYNFTERLKNNHHIYITMDPSTSFRRIDGYYFGLSVILDCQKCDK